MGRIYRRVCFLRSEGRAIDAKRLEETELAEAEAQVLGAAGPQADSEMRSFLAEESERAADAIAFVEILLPELSERIAALKPASPAAPAAPRSPGAAAPKKERGIADFIDEMLAQDHAASH
jgi:hypothetical protein